LAAPALSHRLLTAARRPSIDQALLHTVHTGYLPRKNVSYRHVEATPSHHPLCIELIGIEEKLRRFLNEHAAELHQVKAVLFHCEIPL
jgi:PII-like signaling protein